MKTILSLICIFIVSISNAAAQLPGGDDLTVRPLLQDMGERLLTGKTGSIVAIDPETGKILCLATNSPEGPDMRPALPSRWPMR